MTQPISQFTRRFRRNIAKERQTEEDRNVRRTFDYYEKMNYPKDQLEKMAETDFQIGQRIKKKRGLKGIDLGTLY